MTTFYLIPAAGLVVRDPETRAPLPADGATKPRNRYWLRRVAEGSCTEKTITPNKAED